jgi:hypothetical protein
MGEAALANRRVDVAKCVLFIPPGLKRFKLDLFERIGRHMTALGASVIRHDYEAVKRLPDDRIPLVGCMPPLRDNIWDWMRRRRTWIYWDRGYLRRVFATWLPTGAQMGIRMGYYRWHLNAPQMREIYDVPDDRWKALLLDASVKPWRKSRPNDPIIIADTLPDYWNTFSDPQWTKRTKAELQKYTKRDIIIRDKESKYPLYKELENAHALVAHGSIAAVESVVMGCPVFVSDLSAAALMGKTNIAEIENPVYPDRTKWLHSLAYCQFTEDELVDGTLWRLIR